MLQYDLNAQERGVFGKGAARKLRRDGKTPAIMYGSKTEPMALTLDTKELMKSLLNLQRRNAVFNIDIEGDGTASRRHVMIKEVQSDPIKDTLVHADFCEVALDEAITLQVPVNLKGVAKGVELGGEMIINLSAVTVKGNVLDIPDFFEVDVTALTMGQKVTCADLQVSGNLELLHESEEVCASVQTARNVVEEEEEEAAEGAESSETEEETSAAE